MADETAQKYGESRQKLLKQYPGDMLSQPTGGAKDAWDFERGLAAVPDPYLPWRFVNSPAGGLLLGFGYSIMPETPLANIEAGLRAMNPDFAGYPPDKV